MKKCSGDYYYRGQADSWKLAPGILRIKDKVNSVVDFENIYKELAEKIEDLEFCDIKSMGDMVDSFEERNTELGILQHYGFPTPLIDITSNPFVALLFMCDGRKIPNNYRRKRLDIFKIDNKVHSEKNIFSRVYMDHRNKRIDVQSGEFFDFSKYEFMQKENIEIHEKEKIPHASIILDYEDDDGYKYSKREFMRDVLDTFLVVDRSNELNKKNVETLFDKYRELLIYDKDSLKKMLCPKPEYEKIVWLLYQYHKKTIESDYSVRTAVDADLTNKLKEYFYIEDDLYPDKYKKIEYAKRKHFL